MSLEDRVRRLEEACGIEDDTVVIGDYQYPADSLRIVDAEVVASAQDGYCLLWDDDDTHGWNAQKYGMDEPNGWWISRGEIPDDVFEEYYESASFRSRQTARTSSDVTESQNDLPSTKNGHFQMQEEVDVSGSPFTLYHDGDDGAGFWLSHEDDDDIYYAFYSEFERLKEMVERHA